MVTNCFREPLPGWIDTISAVGAAGFPCGMGFSRNIFLPNQVLDFIPADLCSNSILVTTAYAAA